MQKKRLAIAGTDLSVTLLPGTPGGPLLYLHGAAGEADGLPTFPSASLAVVEGMDWSRDLSPWAAPPVFGKEPFAGGGEVYRSRLISQVLPAVEAVLESPPAWRGIAGYSLAGLFALYAAVSSPTVFSRAASVSGSLWFDGFVDWLASAGRAPERVYLSVGDREKLTRNPRMAAVEVCTDRAEAILRAAGAAVIRQTNPGGHFCEVSARLARGIAALLPANGTEETV